MFKHIFYELEGAAPNAPAPQETTEQSVEVPDIATREAELTLRENSLAAKEQLRSANIPEGFLDFVVNKDITQQQAGIDKLIKLWNTGLKEAVKSRIAGDAPTITSTPAKKFSELTYAEKLALKKSSPDAYRLLVAQA